MSRVPRIYFRHIAMEDKPKRDKFVRRMKKTFQLLVIGLVILGSEKLTEFLSELLSGSVADTANTTDCTCNSADACIFHITLVLC